MAVSGSNSYNSNANKGGPKTILLATAGLVTFTQPRPSRRTLRNTNHTFNNTSLFFLSMDMEICHSFPYQYRTCFMNKKN